MFPTVIKLIPFIEAIGIIAFCISGFIRAQQRKFDAIGVFIIGFVTAFGGGTLRDILLDRRPFYWVEHQNYVIAIFICSLLGGTLMDFTHRVFSRRAMLVADAMGLGLFTITSTAVALEAGMPYFVASMLGMIGAAFGGVIRDILCGDTPLLLTDSSPYASCAFAGSWIYIGLRHLHANDVLSLLIASGVIVFLRLISIKLKWEVPKGF
ncbi:trimeric intracellular cation channel family protein [Hydromonas duriensis]|uniref:Putative membrane protein YeiH n=1 Tax=Hydromonas duriensis TaxID=1527608 RepID=A0A4R6YBS0_9BURK|nr:trimeric intracellular cation channel family protein [Hydromonas duriensis]TDR33147.1 putative membrane protein YeiH [Hydromonas duriensis]